MYHVRQPLVADEAVDGVGLGCISRGDQAEASPLGLGTPGLVLEVSDCLRGLLHRLVPLPRHPACGVGKLSSRGGGPGSCRCQ